MRMNRYRIVAGVVRHRQSTTGRADESTTGIEMKRCLLLATVCCALACTAFHAPQTKPTSTWALAAEVPATQPTTAPADDFPALRRRLAELQATIIQLKAELAAVTKERDALRATAAQEPRAGLRPKSFEDAKKILVEKLKPGVKREQVLRWLGKSDEQTRDGGQIIESYLWEGGADWDVIECTYSEDGVLIAARETMKSRPTVKSTVGWGGDLK